MIRKVFPVMLMLAVLVFSATVFADVLASNLNTNASLQSTAVGQSVTTGVGGPWNNIIFNFYSDSPATTPTAFGTVFLLTQAYTGTPAALSSATSGFVASAAAAGGLYTFASNVTLQAGTQYFFYTNATGQVSGNGADVYAGGSVFLSDGSSPYTAFPTEDAAFRLQGSAVTAVPEPSSLMLLGTGLSAIAGGIRRKLRR